jgi:hypothetical protein
MVHTAARSAGRPAGRLGSEYWRHHCMGFTRKEVGLRSDGHTDTSMLQEASNTGFAWRPRIDRTDAKMACSKGPKPPWRG